MYLYTVVLMMNDHPDGLQEAEGIIGDEGTNNLGHLSFLPLPQTNNLGHLSFLPLPRTMGSKVIEVQYLQCLQCHLNWTVQMGPDILDEVEGIERKCI